MNLSVNDSNIYQVVHDLRRLIKECLLPRIDQLEDEVRELREMAWPIYSGVLSGGYDHLKEFDKLETMVRKKSEVIKRLFPDEVWRWGRSQEELKKIYSVVNNEL